MINKFRMSIYNILRHLRYIEEIKIIQNKILGIKIERNKMNNLIYIRKVIGGLRNYTKNRIQRQMGLFRNNMGIQGYKFIIPRLRYSLRYLKLRLGLLLYHLLIMRFIYMGIYRTINDCFTSWFFLYKDYLLYSFDNFINLKPI